MSTTNATSEYLLHFRGTDWDRSLSPAALQDTMPRLAAWFERLTAEGTIKGGQPLMDEARIVSGRKGRLVVDGPFAESKDAVGGYLLIEAASFDDAVAIAQQFLMLECGTAVEVRPVAAVFPTMQRARQAMGEELAAGV